VWNGDFLNVAIRNSSLAGSLADLSVAEFATWEADFLKLIDYNTNVTMSDYVGCVRRLAGLPSSNDSRSVQSLPGAASSSFADGLSAMG